jgi:hypothetical protein
MAEARRRWLCRSWLPEVGAAFSRLRLALLLADFLTFLKLWADNPSEAELKIFGKVRRLFPLGDRCGPFYRVPGTLQTDPGHGLDRWHHSNRSSVRFQWQVWFVVPLLFCGVNPGRRPVGPISGGVKATPPSGCSTTGFGSPPRSRSSGRACSAAASPSSSTR